MSEIVGSPHDRTFPGFRDDSTNCSMPGIDRMVVERKPNVLLVKNGDAHFRPLVTLLRTNGFHIHATSETAVAASMVEHNRYQAVIADLSLPELDAPVILRRARAAAADSRVIFIARPSQEGTARRLVHDGAAGYFLIPFDSSEVLTALRGGGKAEKFPVFCGIVGSSPAVRAMIELIRKVAETSSTVLVLGESGSGKELVARAVHELSPRHANPFVVVHCGAIPETLLESELFGHERGAFTGAVASRKGLLESAHTGTVFLDEIGEVTPAMQVKLLRVIESGVVRPVGSNKDVKVDARIIAATNRDLRELVQLGSFREDLYYRLNVFPIRVPPLRERREDIEVLARYFLQRAGAERLKATPEIDDSAMELLKRYSWPGNIRELENVIERAAILSGGGPISNKHLPREVQTASAPAVTRGIYEMPFREARNTFERSYLEQMLDRCDGNVALAARTAGVSRAYFYEIIKRYGVKVR